MQDFFALGNIKNLVIKLLLIITLLFIRKVILVFQYWIYFLNSIMFYFHIELSIMTKIKIKFPSHQYHIYIFIYFYLYKLFLIL